MPRPVHNHILSGGLISGYEFEGCISFCLIFQIKHVVIDLLRPLSGHSVQSRPPLPQQPGPPKWNISNGLAVAVRWQSTSLSSLQYPSTTDSKRLLLRCFIIS